MRGVGAASEATGEVNLLFREQFGGGEATLPFSATIACMCRRVPLCLAAMGGGRRRRRRWWRAGRPWRASGKDEAVLSQGTAFADFVFGDHLSHHVGNRGGVRM